MQVSRSVKGIKNFKQLLGLLSLESPIQQNRTMVVNMKKKRKKKRREKEKVTNTAIDV